MRERLIGASLLATICILVAVALAALAGCASTELKDKGLANTQYGRMQAVSDQTFNPTGSTVADSHVVVVKDRETDREFLIVTSPNGNVAVTEIGKGK